MMNRFFATLFICLFGIHAYAQRVVQDLYLSNQEGNRPSWFVAYANGDYETAFNTMAEQNIKPPKNQFFTNAYLYANRTSIILDSTPKTWGDDFYNNFPKSTVQFNVAQSVTLPLDRNLFKATIGGDTLNVVLDTGGHGISISKKLVEKYNLPTDTSITGTSYMPAFRRVSTTSPTIIERLNFGNLELNNLRGEFTIAVDDDGQFQSQQQYDVFMGLDVLIGLVDYVRFDWTKGEITFSNEVLVMDNPQPFLFFDSKPITVLQLANTSLTTVIDTGSPVDILNYEFYKDHYSKKEEKKYGDYGYNLYTVPIAIQNSEFELGVADYMEGFNLKLDEEMIDLIIGTAHQQLTIDMKNNLFEIK
ncbi:MAG: retropepsin-like domain-containing protein [bacterium]|nr:retropepsin-like domain-containing protein [bacterium]